MAEANEQHERWGEFLHLQDPKSFSRLLYTNPVCLLATVRNSKTNANPFESLGAASESSSHREPQSPTRNVMVISWLTAMNNSGKFIMSVNKNRHTASVLVPNQNIMNDDVEFVLCVPVAGMEDLVRNVGRTSGRWGKSKFPSDRMEQCSSGDGDEASFPIISDNHAINSVSYQDKKDSSAGKSNAKNSTPKSKPRSKRKKFENGIDGLVAVQIGTSSREIRCPSRELFAIQRTVAHLQCTTCGRIKETEEMAKALDDDHYLIVAQVTDAYVRKDYWNEGKSQFQPMKYEEDGKDKFPPPYLTFFGSQTFGYVVTNENIR